MFKLTKQQQEIINSPARVKIVMGGYRSGKTALAIMNIWEEMKRQNTPHFRAVYLVNSDNLMAYTIKEMEQLLPKIVFIKKISSPHGYVSFETKLGIICISKKFLPYDFDNITIDNASSNTYVNKDLLDARENVFIAGHLPEDTDNVFFKLWLYAYFAEIPDVATFRLSPLDEDKNKYDKELRARFGITRYNRNYLCIPDYLEEMHESPWKREYIGRFVDAVENHEITFAPKNAYILGFDKAKE
jgi:hypothetical protein